MASHNTESSIQLRITEEITMKRSSRQWRKKQSFCLWSAKCCDLWEKKRKSKGTIWTKHKSNHLMSVKEVTSHESENSTETFLHIHTSKEHIHTIDGSTSAYSEQLLPMLLVWYLLNISAWYIWFVAKASRLSKSKPSFRKTWTMNKSSQHTRVPRDGQLDRY